MGGFKVKSKGKAGKGPVVPGGANVTFCVNNVSFCMTMNLTDANSLLVALANAINNAATKSQRPVAAKARAENKSSSCALVSLKKRETKKGKQGETSLIRVHECCTGGKGFLVYL